MASGDRDGSSRPATGQGSINQRWEGFTVLARAFSLLSPQISLWSHTRGSRLSRKGGLMCMIKPHV